MITRAPSREELLELRKIAEYQFGVKGDALIPDNILVTISLNTNKIRFILHAGKRYLGIRAQDYRFNLYIPAGRVLNELLPPPLLRVYVKREYAEFVARGGSLFCRHVLIADPNIRPNDEVLILDQDNELIGVGRAQLPGWEMVYYNRGIAVKVREGVQA